MRVDIPSPHNAVVRAWAFRNGVLCPERGQVPSSVRRQFEDAQTALVLKTAEEWQAELLS